MHRLPILLLAILAAQVDVARQKPSAPDSKPAPTPVTKVQPNPIFEEILPVLRQETRVPLRLPAYLAYSDAKLKSRPKTDENADGEDLNASIERADERSYFIQLAFGKDCTGAHACREGGLTGSIVFQDDHPERRKVPVKLRRGIRGYFVDSECGAYCDESILYWSEKGYHYSISSKAASKEELTRVANSAIEVAEAQAQAGHDAAASTNRQIPKVR